MKLAENLSLLLTAMVMNLKRLAAFLWPIFALFKKVLSHLPHFGGSELQHQVNYSLEEEMKKSTWRYGLHRSVKNNGFFNRPTVPIFRFSVIIF